MSYRLTTFANGGQRAESWAEAEAEFERLFPEPREQPEYTQPYIEPSPDPNIEIEPVPTTPFLTNGGLQRIFFDESGSIEAVTREQAEEQIIEQVKKDYPQYEPEMVDQATIDLTGFEFSLPPTTSIGALLDILTGENGVGYPNGIIDAKNGNGLDNGLNGIINGEKESFRDKFEEFVYDVIPEDVKKDIDEPKLPSIGGFLGSLPIIIAIGAGLVILGGLLFRR